MSEAQRRSAAETAAYLRAAEAPTVRGALAPQWAERLYGSAVRLSATRLERFFSCQYAFFLESGLRLRERSIGNFAAPDAGSFTHYILQKMTEQRGGGEDIRALCRRVAEEYIAEQLPHFEEQTERFRYLLRRLSRDTENVALDLDEELSVSQFAPLGFEMPFSVPVGDELVVRGQIDRVDAWEDDGAQYLRVADYKTGRRKEFSLSDAYYGLNLQMLIYLYALERDGRFENPRAGAALYVPARDEIVSAKHNLTDEALEKELAKKARRSGLVLAEERVTEALEGGERKRFLPSGDSLVSAEQMDVLLKDVAAQLSFAAREMRRGSIAAQPVYKNETENACRFCRFKSVCGHGAEPGDDVRRMRRLAAAEAWQKIAERGCAE